MKAIAKLQPWSSLIAAEIDRLRAGREQADKKNSPVVTGLLVDMPIRIDENVDGMGRTGRMGRMGRMGNQSHQNRQSRQIYVRRNHRICRIHQDHRADRRSVHHT